METENMNGSIRGNIDNLAIRTGTVPGTDRIEQKEIEKLNELMRELISANTNLTIKVATCKCENREKCRLFREAQKVAEIIEKLQELRSD